jgi:hypothetical protein
VAGVAQFAASVPASNEVTLGRFLLHYPQILCLLKTHLRANIKVLRDASSSSSSSLSLTGSMSCLEAARGSEYEAETDPTFDGGQRVRGEERETPACQDIQQGRLWQSKQS